MYNNYQLIATITLTWSDAYAPQFQCANTSFNPESHWLVNGSFLLTESFCKKYLFGVTSLWCTLVNPFVVVHPTHILMHPRVHRAHRLKSAGLFHQNKTNDMLRLRNKTMYYCARMTRQQVNNIDIFILPDNSWNGALSPINIYPICANICSGHDFLNMLIISTFVVIRIETTARDYHRFSRKRIQTKTV